MCDGQKCCNEDGQCKCTPFDSLNREQMDNVAKEQLKNERSAQEMLKDSSKPKNPRVLTGYEDIDDFLEDCLDTMKKKGHDYRQGNDDDVLHNFRTVSESVGIDMEKVWFTYFYKHYSALATYIKEGGQQESEPIQGRVKDLIVYLLLFSRMLNERKIAKVSHLGEIYKRAEAAEINFRRLKKLRDANEVQLRGAIALERLENDPDFQEKLAQVKRQGDNVGIKIDNMPKGPVSIEQGTVRMNTDRLRKLAGLQGSGVFYDPEVLERGGEITKTLLERDGKYVKFGGDRIVKEEWLASRKRDSKEARKKAFREAVETAEPLDKRELEAAETIALIAERADAETTGKMDQFMKKCKVEIPSSPFCLESDDSPK